jgi:hypothetical protein
MAQRQWIFVMGLGFLAGMMPACSHTGDRVSRPVSITGSPSDQQPVAKASPRSPYAAVPSLPVASQAKPDHQDVQQARFPVGSQSPDLVPPLEALINPQEQPPPWQPAQSPRVSSLQTEINAKLTEDPPLVAALRCYLNRKPAEAVIWLERYDRINQDLLLCLLPLVTRLTETGLEKSDSRDLAIIIAQLERLLTLIRPSAQLIIEKMCFCDLVEKFGVYHTLGEDHAFHPGELIQVYVELQNFSSFLVSEKEINKRYGIRLASRMEIRNYNGDLVEHWDLKDNQRPDESSAPRHDFFINYRLQVPLNIPPGAYTLHLVVTDVPTKRKAERTLDFRVTNARG